MERKLIKQGGGGLTIYLPKRWIDNKGLKNGDYVSIEQSNDKLVIDKEARRNKTADFYINKENFGEIKNFLLHCYRRGVNKITIKSDVKNSSSKIRTVVNELMLGFELVSTDNDTFVLENLSEINDNNYDSTIRKIFFIIEETQDLVSKDFLSKKSSIKENEDLRNQCDKFILFSRRLISKQKVDKNSILEWELLTFLMHIQHAYYYLLAYSYKKKIVFNKKILITLDDLKSYFTLLKKAYYEKDYSYINKVNVLKKDYHLGELINLIEKSQGPESVVYSKIKEIFRLIQIGTSPIMAMIIDK